jgi:hypothetical protein
MDTVFRLRKYYRDFGIVYLVLFLSVMVLCFCALLSEGSGIFKLLATTSVWGFFAAVSVFVLLAYYRESLTINDERIVQKGVFRRYEMALAEITDVRWRGEPVGGAVTLRSRSQRITILFNNFELEQRQTLIRWLRLSLPPSIQRDWERFCRRIALPLLKARVAPPLDANVALVTRQRWDRLFALLTVLAFFTGVIGAMLLRDARCLVSPAAVVPVWLLMRFITPSRGLRSEKISAMPEKSFFIFIMIWCILGMAVIVPLIKNHSGIAMALMIAWFAVLLFQSHRFDRRRKATLDALAPAAAEEWERLQGTEDATQPG